MRVYELAKELGLSNKEFLLKLKELNFSAKSHLVVLSDEIIEKVRKKVLPKESKTKVKSIPKVRTPRKSAVSTKISPSILETPSKSIPSPEKESIVTIQLRPLEAKLPITVKDLAVKLAQKPSSVIKKLIEWKIMAGINQALDEETIRKISSEFGYELKILPNEEELLLGIHSRLSSLAELKSRPPIVTFMGHVDHGKTSLLDTIRKSKVAEKEYGGITQHIGAYEVILAHGKITFLDTPGHEAFTSMRARGAKITDIVVLVVAADDGVMPQTVEALDHAREAGVSIIVAVNKIDKPQVDIERVKKQLSDLGLTAEDWGGKTIVVGVSAKTGEGIDSLLEMILLEAELLELKANYNKPAKGIVIDAKLSKGKGTTATFLVQDGTLRLNDCVIVGPYFAKIRAMFDDHSRNVKEAGPSFPVEVLGLSGLPDAGEQFYVISDEKKAKELSSVRHERLKEKELKVVQRISLDDLYLQIKEGKIKELKIILKADVQGSLEAISDSIEKLDTTEIKLKIAHKGVGAINTSDVILAEASSAVIFGFNVEADEQAKERASRQGIDIRIYNVIYELISELKSALEGLLEPRLKKIFIGRLEVRKVFKITKSGTVAGSFVQKGKINRNASITLLRNGVAKFEGKLSSLKRFKDDVREVAEGLECGLALAGFDDLQEGDVIEAYEIEKIARKLGEK